MSDYDNELRGALFRNQAKEQGDKKADYTGIATIDGIDYFMDAWLNESKAGTKYLSVKFKRKDKQREPAPQRSATARPDGRAKDEAYQAAGSRKPRHGFDDMDDDIPF